MQQFVGVYNSCMQQNHKTPRRKPEADADHCIAEGAEILVRHT
jgi:hypothetical protein